MTTVTRDEQYAAGLVRKNFVTPAIDAEYTVSSMSSAPMATTFVGGVPSTIAAVELDASGRSFASVQGTHGDYTRALLIKFGAVLVLEGVIVAAILGMTIIAGWLGFAVASVGWLVGTGALGLLSLVAMDRQSLQFSPVGAERHRAAVAGDVAKTTHRETVQAWKDVNIRAIDAYYGHLAAHDAKLLEGKHNGR